MSIKQFEHLNDVFLYKNEFLKLTPLDPKPNDYFGNSVHMASDRLAVGANFKEANGTQFAGSM